MSRLSGSQPAPQTVSETAARAIHRELMSLDSQLQAQVGYVHAASQQIASATMLVNELYAKRSELARELGRVAPEDFGVMPDAIAATIPALSANRFHKPHPLPHGALAPQPAAARGGEYVSPFPPAPAQGEW